MVVWDDNSKQNKADVVKQKITAITFGGIERMNIISQQQKLMKFDMVVLKIYGLVDLLV